MNSKKFFAKEMETGAKARVTGKLEGGNKVVGKKAWLVIGGVMFLGFILTKAMEMATNEAIDKALSYVNSNTAIALGIISLSILAWCFYAENSNTEDSISVDRRKFKFSYASSENKDRLLDIRDLKSFSIRNFLMFKIYVFKFSEETHQIKRGVFVGFDRNAASEETDFVKQMRSLGFPPSPIRFIYPAIGVLQIGLSIISYLVPAVIAYQMANIRMAIMTESQQQDDKNYVKNLFVSSLPSINASLPQKVDRITTLEKVTIENYSVVYHYKIVNYSGYISSLGKGLQKRVWPKLIKDNCNNTDAVKIYKPGIFSLRYSYVHESGIKLGDFVFDSSLCTG